CWGGGGFFWGVVVLVFVLVGVWGCGFVVCCVFLAVGFCGCGGGGGGLGLGGVVGCGGGRG
ncbi:hypothetical protein RA268_27990, partial [Pseudomonas syringae pv. tagetis]